MTRSSQSKESRTAAGERGDALNQAHELVQELARLAPVLTADHKSHLMQKLANAFASQGETMRAPSKPMRVAAANRSASRPVPEAAATIRPMVACPHCKSAVRAHRLDAHIAKIHPLKSTRAPAGPSRRPGIYELSKGTEPSRPSRERIVCGDCERMIFRDDYATHDCRPERRRGPVVMGGAPGLGRRR